MLNDEVNNNNIKVVKKSDEDADITNIELLIASESNEEIVEYDRQRIVDSLVKETGMARSTANQIAARVDREIRKHNYEMVSTSFIRELVQLELRRRGFTKKVEEYDNVVFPLYNIENVINSITPDDSLYKIDATVSSYVLKNFSLKRIFSSDVRDAHLSGRIHLHGLDSPLCFYQSAISLEYIKKYGMKLFNQASLPPCDLKTLLDLTAKFLSYFNSYFVGAVGLSYVNVFLAPFVSDMDDDDVNESLLCFLHNIKNINLAGHKKLFVEMGIYWGIPDVLKDAPVLGPGNKYMVVVEFRDISGGTYQKKLPLLDVVMKGNKWKPRHIKMLQEQFSDEIVDIRLATYADFEDEARSLAKMLLEYNSIQSVNSMHLPNFKFVVSLGVDKVDDNLLSLIANGLNIDIIIDRDQKYIRQPCGGMLDINGTKGNGLNTDNFLNDGIVSHITVNLPQCIYRCNELNKANAFDAVSDVIHIAAEAHKEKWKYIKSSGETISIINELMNDNGLNIVKNNIPKCSLGFVGLEEFTEALSQIDNSVSVDDLRLEVLSHIYLCLKELSSSYGINFVMEESISESVNMRFCRIDLKRYDMAKKLIKGDKRTDKIYYTDSTSISYSKDVPLLDRIKLESLKHGIIKGGLNLLLFMQHIPNNDELRSLLQHICEDTTCEGLSLALRLTFCNECLRMSAETSCCPYCNSEHLSIVSHDGYSYSFVSTWNGTKLGEFMGKVLY